MRWVYLAILGLILLGLGYYVYSNGTIMPLQQGEVVTVTQTVIRANQTDTITTTQVEVQTQTVQKNITTTETAYAPSSGAVISAFKINYYSKGSTEYKNTVANSPASLLTSTCNLPLAVIDPGWSTSTSSKYYYGKARGEVEFNSKCVYKNLSSGDFGVRVCVVGTPLESSSKYTTSNLFPKVAIVDGVLIVGDVTSIMTYKIPCPSTKKTDIYIYRINGTMYDTLKVTVDCCGVTAVNYGLNTQFIIPLQSMGIDTHLLMDSGSILLYGGAIILALAFILYFIEPKKGRRRK